MRRGYWVYAYHSVEYCKTVSYTTSEPSSRLWRFTLRCITSLARRVAIRALRRCAACAARRELAMCCACNVRRHCRVPTAPQHLNRPHEGKAADVFTCGGTTAFTRAVLRACGPHAERCSRCTRKRLYRLCFRAGVLGCSPGQIVAAPASGKTGSSILEKSGEKFLPG